MITGVKQIGRFWGTISKGGIIIPFEFPNGMTTAGLNALASAELGGGTQYTTWYLGLINNSGYTAIAVADTSASHPGWTELTDYTASNRPPVSFGAPASGVIATSSAVSFTMNATVSVKKAFLITNDLKGGSIGIMRAHGVFDSAQAFSSGEVFTINYSSTYS